MLFALICTDKPNSMALRQEVRPKHLAYIEQSKTKVALAGPFLSEDGQSMVGSLIVVEALNIAEAKAFSANDPYALAELFSGVEIKPWRWVVGAPKVV